MRRFSIYLTWAALRWRLSPNQVTLISLMSVFAGFTFLACSLFGTGILLINLWYLLDHVDGEIARYTGKVSATGLFFDTAVNYFVQPLTFLGLGLGLFGSVNDGRVLIWSGLGAFGYLMLTLLPLCEETVVRQFLKAKGDTVGADIPQDSSSIKGLPRLTFARLHKFVLFPNFLLALTIVWIGAVLTGFVDASVVARAFVVLYSASVTLVWTAQFAYKVISAAPDRQASSQ